MALGAFTSSYSLLIAAVCCLLSAVCCLLSAVCCLLSAVCCLLSAVCCLLSAVCCLQLAYGRSLHKHQPFFPILRHSQQTTRTIGYWLLATGYWLLATGFHHSEALAGGGGVGAFRELAAVWGGRRDASTLLFEFGACGLSRGQTTERVQGAPYDRLRQGYRCAAPASFRSGPAPAGKGCRKKAPHPNQLIPKNISQNSRVFP
jgi:hypothetical protein